MKKSLVLKLIVFVFAYAASIQINAQVNLGGDANYVIDLHLSQHRGMSNCNGGGGFYSIKLNGITDHYFYNDDNRFQFNGSTQSYTHEYTKSNSFVNVQLNAADRRNNDSPFEECRSSRYHERYIQLDNKTCYSTTGFQTYQPEHDNDISYEVNIYPKIQLNEPNTNDYLSDEDFLTITLPNNIDTDYYNWEYSITDANGNGANNYISFPSTTNGRITNNISILRIKGSEFLSDDDLGKIISIRVNPNCNVGNPSNTIKLEYLRTAPTIVNAIPEPVTCYDDSDGQVRIFFSKALASSSDKISISILDLSNQTGTTIEGEPIYAPLNQFPNIEELEADNSILLTGLKPSASGYQSQIELFIPNYYTGGTNHTTKITIERPRPVDFEISNTVHEWCYGGNDGEIHLEASGGNQSGYQYTYKIQGSNTEDNWLDFDNTTSHTIKNLIPETYEIKVRDSNACVARVQVINDITGELELQEDLVLSTTVNAIEKPLSINMDLINEPRAFNFKDGRILATISGGTAYEDGSYDFEWYDQDGNPLTTTNTTVNLDGDYEITLHSIGKGDYNLVIKDANYNNASTPDTRIGCTTTSESFTLNHPDPIEISIDIQNPISCNINNEYSNGVDFENPLDIFDQFQDGILVATVTGGVPFDETTNASAGECRENLKPYCYTWKKNINGVWEDVGVNDYIIENQSVGDYALNVEDKNGISLGNYQAYTLADGSTEYELVEALDKQKNLPQPEQLELTFTKTDVTCSSGNNGKASVVVSGGIGPFTYSWSNGESADKIEELFAGKYTVHIIDSKGCEIKGNVTIEQPNGLSIETSTLKSPTCYQGDDGEIILSVSGGIAPYTYSWEDSSKTDKRSNLVAGIYTVEITDAQNCKAFKEFTLTDPDPIIVNLEEYRALCREQSFYANITIDDPGASYIWTSDNGFTSSSSNIEITESGTYTATITSSLGCIGIGSINVEVFDTPIDSDFLLTTQAYTEDDVILVNVSEPIGDTVTWTVPDNVDIISKNDEQITLKFKEEGAYDIKLTSTQGDCFEDYIKTILVQPAIESPIELSNNTDFIEEFLVYPNPNNGGTFKTKIGLAEDANITLKIINIVTGATLDERSEKNNLDFLLDYNISLPSGIYLLLLETPKGSQTRKLIFN